MRRNALTEIAVGIFMMLGALAFIILALKVSGLTAVKKSSYLVNAEFDNIGDLKVRAPLTIAGVRIGEVKEIKLDAVNFKARVTLMINASQDHIPADSSASILTEGLLGSNYVSLAPGFSEGVFLHQGSLIEDTHPALILENLISQLVFNMNKGNDKEKEAKGTTQ